MRIGIIGAGMIGSALAKRLTALSHTIAIANSRGPETLRDALGFDAVDAGGLEDSWRQQPGAPCYGKELDAAR